MVYCKRDRMMESEFGQVIPENLDPEEVREEIENRGVVGISGVKELCRALKMVLKKHMDVHDNKYIRLVHYESYVLSVGGSKETTPRLRRTVTEVYNAFYRTEDGVR